MPDSGNQEDTNRAPSRVRFILKNLFLLGSIAAVTRRAVMALGDKVGYGLGGGLLGALGISELVLRYRAQRPITGAGSEEQATERALEEGQVQGQDQLETLGGGATVSRTDEIPPAIPSPLRTAERVTRPQPAFA